MVRIKVNGKVGTVNVGKGSTVTVTFEEFSQSVYLFDINTTPDTRLYEGEDTSISLSIPNIDTTILLRAYDYCTGPGEYSPCLNPSNDVVINVGVGEECSPWDIACKLTPSTTTKVLIAGTVVALVLGAAYLVSRSPTSTATMVKGAKNIYKELRA